jgi:hypothetical protein
VRGVAIQIAASDETIAKAREDEIAGKLVAWGCEAWHQQDRTRFSCGKWEATLRYAAVIRRVMLEAAEEGFMECR